MGPVLRKVTGIVCLLALMGQVALAKPSTKHLLLSRGLALRFALVKELRSDTANIGDKVELRLTRPLVVDGVTILPEGTTTFGQVTKIRRPSKKCRCGAVEWRLDSFQLSDGTRVRSTVVFAADDPNEKVEDRYDNQYLHSRRGSILAGIAFVPIAILMPWAAAMAFAGQDCEAYGSNGVSVLPSNSTVAVAVVKRVQVAVP